VNVTQKVYKTEKYYPNKLKTQIEHMGYIQGFNKARTQKLKQTRDVNGA
jgi:hypothetical protein